jgi:hypothetical protein
MSEAADHMDPKGPAVRLCRRNIADSPALHTPRFNHLPTQARSPERGFNERIPLSSRGGSFPMALRDVSSGTQSAGGRARRSRVDRCVNGPLAK